MSNLPAIRATLEDIERARGEAISLYAQAWDTEEAARQASRRAYGHIPVPEARSKIHASYKSPDRSKDDRDRHLAEVTKQLDQTIWERLIECTELEQLMDKEARDQFRAELCENPPPATADNCRATVEEMFLRRDEIFRRGIANVFSGLDRRFRSHDGFKVGSRIILDGAFGAYSGWNYHRRIDEKLRDVERTFCILDRKPVPERHGGIIGEIQDLISERPFEHEGEYFKAVGYKNGNLHLWMRRDDLVRMVNRLLADYYGETIAAGADVADVSDMGPGYHVTPAKNFGFFETPEAVAYQAFEHLGSFSSGASVLEPSAGRGALARIAREKGASVTCVEIQHGNCAELRQQGFDVREGDFLQMGVEMLGQFDLIVMNPPFDRGRDCDHVRHALQFLKPGGALVSVMSARTEYAEDRRTASFRTHLEKNYKALDWGGRFFRSLPEHQHGRQCIF